MPVTQTEASFPTPTLAVEDELPERNVAKARAVLERGRFSWLWVVAACPYCGKQHDHFAGPLDGDPYQYVGMTFAARCDRTDRRRLAVDYPSGALWYQLTPAQPDEQTLAAESLRSIARG
jgi:hypothetical protein